MGSRKITTPIFRASFCNLLEPRQNQNGGWYYGLVMIFEPDADLSEMKAVFTETVADKWKGQPPKTGVRSPFRRGEWKSDAYPRGYDLDKNPEYEGKIIVSANAYTTQLDSGAFPRDKAPGVVGPDPRQIFDAAREPLYSGMFGRACVSAYVPKERPGVEASVVFGLHHFQKCYDGEPLGGGNGKPEDAFGVFESPKAAGYHDDLLGI